KVAAKYEERKSEIYDKARRLYVKGELENGFPPEIIKEIMRYNELVIGSGRTDITFITAAGLKSVIRRAAIAPKQERMRAAVGM
ncbi:MAG: hypothetical protein SCH71_17485, partial [Desulfobulbaceae bacterium]|nr:hypothetical protein [Desulfobulbaceae bacterium]